MRQDDFAAEHLRGNSCFRAGRQGRRSLSVYSVAQHRDGGGNVGDHVSAGLLVQVDVAIGNSRKLRKHVNAKREAAVMQASLFVLGQSRQESAKKVWNAYTNAMKRHDKGEFMQSLRVAAVKAEEYSTENITKNIGR